MPRAVTPLRLAHYFMAGSQLGKLRRIPYKASRRLRVGVEGRNVIVSFTEGVNFSNQPGGPGRGRQELVS